MLVTPSGATQVHSPVATTWRTFQPLATESLVGQACAATCAWTRIAEADALIPSKARTVNAFSRP